MTHLHTKPLSDLITIAKGKKAPEVLTVPTKTSLRYLQIEDLRPDANAKYCEPFNCPRATKSDVIIAWDGANAGTASCNLEGHIGSTLAVLRFASPTNLSAPFLSRFLQGNFAYLQKTATGATIPHISRDALTALQIPMLPLAEQEHIVRLLDDADELLKLRAQADRRTADLLPALFHEMFGDPAANPKRLPVVSIGEVIHPIEFGISEALSTGCEYQAGRIAVLRIANITAEGTLDYTDLRYLKVSDATRNRLLLTKGELLFNWRNSPKWVGKTAIFDHDEPCIFASFLYRLRARTDLIDRHFLWFYLNHLRRSGFFESKCRQAVSQANLGRDELSAVQIILPPLPMQKEFARLVTETHELQAQQAASRRLLEDLFQSLLHRAFRGQV
jgi:type I restriction enzyme, S subunit